MIFIAFVKFDSKHPRGSDGYVLVEAETKEQAKEKIENYYKGTVPNSKPEAKIGDTIL